MNLIDHVISQPKIREMFKQNTNKVDTLVETLLQMVKS